MPGDETVPQIHPAEAVPAGWLVAGLLLLALCILMPFLVAWWRRRMHRRDAQAAPDALEKLREEQLARLDAVVALWESGALSAAEAVQQASGVARGFVGAALDSDVDFMTLEELDVAARQLPKTRELSRLVREVYPVAFAGGTDANPAETMRRFREVIQLWS